MAQTGDIVTLDSRRQYQLLGGPGEKPNPAEGTFGLVYAALPLSASKDAETPVALKLVNRSEMRKHADLWRDEARAQELYRGVMQREGQILSAVAKRWSNPHDVNIVRLVDRGTVTAPAGKDAGFPALAMELCASSLEEAIVCRDPDRAGGDLGSAGALWQHLASVDGLLHLAHSILVALQALSSLPQDTSVRVAHRDLKPGNILVKNINDGRRPTYLLSDLGSIKTFAAPTGSVGNFTQSYAPPEVRQAHRRRGPKGTTAQIDHSRVDIYALAVILFECVTRYLPLYHQEDISETAAILTARELSLLRDGLVRLPDTPAGPTRRPAPNQMAVRDGLRAFILKCLSISPDQRPTLLGALQHVKALQHQIGLATVARPTVIPLRAGTPTIVAETVSVPPVRPVTPAKPGPVRRTGRVIAAALLAGCLAAAMLAQELWPMEVAIQGMRHCATDGYGGSAWIDGTLRLSVTIRQPLWPTGDHGMALHPLAVRITGNGARPSYQLALPESGGPACARAPVGEDGRWCPAFHDRRPASAGGKELVAVVIRRGTPVDGTRVATMLNDALSGASSIDRPLDPPALEALLASVGHRVIAVPATVPTRPQNCPTQQPDLAATFSMAADPTPGTRRPAWTK